DPQCFESDSKQSKGLGYLDVTTEIEERKQLKQVNGRYRFNGDEGKISGYEIHCGKSSGAGLENWF
ncbi:MAG: hypothetical protein L3J46_10005, partial [Kangiellaceae bacterium]|nr:hypothetical protein [Kangiellaceae bacterium]